MLVYGRRGIMMQEKEIPVRVERPAGIRLLWPRFMT